MEWYEKKFREFFKECDRGDLYLKSGQSYFGTVKGFVADEDFGESTIRFEYTREANKPLPKPVEGHFPIKEVQHFRATDGSVLNIQKYLNIVEMEKEHLRELEGAPPLAGKVEEEVEKVGEVEEVEEREAKEVEKAEEEERELVCIALGLEFYAPKKMANLLKANVKDILFTQLKDVPVLMVKEQPVVELTPTFSRWVKTIKVSLAPKGKRGKR